MNSADLLQSIFENAIDGIIVIDEKGIIELVNPSLCKLFNYLPAELIGEDINMLISKPDHALYQQFQLTREAGIIDYGKEVNAVKKDGSIFPLHLTVSETVSNGRVAFTGIVHDLTQEKHAEECIKQYTSGLESIIEERTQAQLILIQQLKQVQQDLNTALLKEKEINKMKSRFVAMASHEFRLPLSNIQLSACLVERYYDRMDQEKKMLHLKKIRMSVNDLTTVLNNFLSVEKLESGNLKPEFKEFDLTAFSNEIVGEMNPMAKSGQRVCYQHTGEETSLILDKGFLKHCIINLISNAIKYSDETGVIEYETEIKQKVCLIKIKDTGIGIPKDCQPHLFEAFFRAKNTGDIPGTGLGLSIVDHYVRLMNGKIEFKSDVKSGTIFLLTFPVNRSPLTTPTFSDVLPESLDPV